MAKLNWERASQRSCFLYDGMGVSRPCRGCGGEVGREGRPAREVRRAGPCRASGEGGEGGCRTTHEGREQALAAAAKPRHLHAALRRRGARTALQPDRDRSSSKLKMDVGVLRRRRLLALNAGHSVKEILEAGGLEGPIGCGPLRRSSAPRSKGVGKAPVQGVGPLPITSRNGSAEAEARVTGRADARMRTQAREGPEPQRRSPRGGAGRPPTPRRPPQPTARLHGPRPPPRRSGQRPNETGPRRRAEVITVDQLTAERRARAAEDADRRSRRRHLG